MFHVTVHDYSTGADTESSFGDIELAIAAYRLACQTHDSQRFAVDLERR